MKNILFLFLLFASQSFATIDQWEQYPEERNYTSSDRGMKPYLARSLYKTSTFTLTFDDGPHETRTNKILDVLKKFQVKATFFVLTSSISESDFPIIKRILDEGHLLGSHGFNHDRSSDLTQLIWKQRVAQSFMDLAKWHKRAGHEMTKFFYRFPYGDYGGRTDYHHINALRELSRELLGDNCIHMAFWDVDTADWVPGMTSQEVAQNIMAHLEGGTYIDFKKVGNTYVKVPLTMTNPPGGGVVLQHDVHEVNVKATELFLQYAHDRGVHLPRLDEVEEFLVTKNCKL